MLRQLHLMITGFVVFLTACGAPDYNPLDLKWAKYIAANPGGEKKGTPKAIEAIGRAWQLQMLGHNHYWNKQDSKAIPIYEKALRFHASGELYFLYANSLSNIPRLEDSLKAYQIALFLGYTNGGITAYNAACTYSRMKRAKEAIAMLEQALAGGYRELGHIQTDPDLRNLREAANWGNTYHKLVSLDRKLFFSVPMQQMIIAYLEKGDVSSAKKILDQNPGKRIPEDVRAAVFEEILKLGNDHAAKFMIQYILSPNDMKGETVSGMRQGVLVLHQAIWKKKPELARLLIAKGADVTRYSVTGPYTYHLITEAAALGYFDLVKLCLDRGVAPDEAKERTTAFTALLLAVGSNHKDIVRLLLERGADMHYSSSHGANVFSLAIDKPEIMKMLVAWEKKTKKQPVGKQVRTEFLKYFNNRKLVNKPLNLGFVFQPQPRFIEYGVGTYRVDRPFASPDSYIPEEGTFRLTGDMIRLYNPHAYLNFSRTFRIWISGANKMMINGSSYIVSHD